MEEISNFVLNQTQILGGNSSVGRALASQAEGRGFEPRFPLQLSGRFVLYFTS